MLLKLGVDISKLDIALRRALNIISHVYGQHEEEAVITSTYEGVHSPGSLHYAHKAVDIRHPRVEKIVSILEDLRSRLSEDYDVVREDTHIHIEYDPKS